MDQRSLDRELYEASEQGNLESARALLDRGADPNAEGFSWYSCALQAAARRTSVELVQLLLDRGANINTAGGYHGSALIGAAQYGNTEIVILLVNAGANLNERGQYGTALAVARDKHFEDVVKILERAGATEWRPDNKGY
ncbi:ankyrin repeat-containing domain protein [Aspergillus pseudocaelatus]|uniref:Ankyrin repeat-containing domain protein n=1 Tax=Aspergillus pseudocaelatus TaxID=1825620 RepID=A0ABQ6X2P9_9EURO|nr:ankyrin repeat-containing domain protein [Aspergillus pseudocaelatus]